MFGEKLKELRISKGLTQEELGKILNKTKNNISQYETSKREPDSETLKTLADFFGVSVDYLLGRTDIRTITQPTTEPEMNNKPLLTAKDEKDIAKDVDKIMTKLENQEDGPIYFNGQEVSEDDAELFRDALQLALRRIKVKNKETYTPKKYKK